MKSICSDQSQEKKRQTEISLEWEREEKPFHLLSDRSYAIKTLHWTWVHRRSNCTHQTFAKCNREGDGFAFMDGLTWLRQALLVKSTNWFTNTLRRRRRVQRVFNYLKANKSGGKSFFVSQHNTSLNTTNKRNLSEAIREVSEALQALTWQPREIHVDGNWNERFEIKASWILLSRLWTHFGRLGPMALQPSPSLTVHIATLWSSSLMWWEQSKLRLSSSTSFQRYEREIDN